MRRFTIQNLLVATTLAAIAFAIARLFDYGFAFAALVTYAVFAPCICYGIAAIAAARKRSLRRALRYSLLSVTVGGFVIAGVFVNGPSALLPLGFLLFLVWAPQLILLEICSTYRSALVGTSC